MLKRLLVAATLFLGLGIAGAQAQLTATGVGGAFGGTGCGAANCYYFANGGSDSNNCSTPALACQTITHLNTLTISANSAVLFNGGQTFTTTIGITPTLSGNTTFTSYGTGQATISSSAAASCSTFVNPPGSVTFNNFICVGAATLTTPHPGLYLSNTGGANISAAAVTNMTISGYGFDCVALSGTNGWNSVTITGNTIHDCGEDASTNPLGEGHGIDLDAFSTTSLTAFTNVTISNNTIFNVLGTSGVYSGVGINAGGMTTYTIANNVIHDGGGNNATSSGADGIVVSLSTGGTIQENEIYNYTTGSGGDDGGGIDLDWSTENTVVQYNYTHNNEGYGYLIFQFTNSGNPNNSGNTIRFNISQNDNLNDTVSSKGSIQIGAPSSTISGCAIYNNTIFSNSGGVGIGQNTSGGTVGCTLSNNIIYTSGDFVSFPTLTGVTLVFNGNDYWTPFGTADGVWSWGGTNFTTLSSWGQDSTHGKQVNPLLNAAGLGATQGGYTPLVLGQQYELQSISGLVAGNGQNITSPGTQDFFGNAVTASTLPVGAGDAASATITLTNVGLTTFAGDNLATNSAVPSGALFVVLITGNAANTTITAPTVTGCTGSMTQQVQNTNTAAILNTAIFFCTPASGITSGASVGNSADTTTAAFYATGVSTSDKTNSVVHATGTTSISLATTTLASANELIFADGNWTTGLSTYVESAGFQSLVSGQFTYGSVEIVTSTTAVTWAPAFTPSQTSSSVIGTFH